MFCQKLLFSLESGSRFFKFKIVDVNWTCGVINTLLWGNDY